jgi:Repair protein Rad1/Rec1/Rad17
MSDIPEGTVLSARLENVRFLSDALSCIYSSAHKSQDVLVSVPPKGGLKFAVEQPGCLHASVLLPLTSFAQFSCSDSTCRVRLNLSLLLDCIDIFAGNSVAERGPMPVRLSFDGVGHALVLIFKEQDQDAVTLCKLNTIDNEYAEEMETDFQFRREDVKNMAILESEPLRDAIAELDYAGATTAELRLAPTVPRFRFQSPAVTFRVVDADGVKQREGRGGGKSARKRRRVRSEELDDDDSSGSSDFDENVRTYAEESAADNEVCEAQCAIELPDPEDRTLSVFHEFRSEFAQTSCYRLDLLGRCSRALSMSETSKLQMNLNGTLSIVCKMRPGMASSNAAAAERRPVGGCNEHCFTEFLVVADEIGEDADVDSASTDDVSLRR